MEQQGTKYDLAFADNLAEHAESLENGGLAVLFRYIKRYFDGQADTDDLDILVFGLNYLYCSLDTLYRLALPDLASSPAWGAEEVGKIERAWGAAEAALSNGSFDITDFQTVHTMRDAVDELIQRHHHWMQLQAIQQVLERLASLSQILCTTVGNLLEALDLHAGELLAARQELTGEQHKHVGAQELHGPGEQRVAERQERQPYEQYLQHLAEQEHWDEAVKQLTDALSDWQRSQHQQRTFKTVFAGLQRNTAVLEEIDSGFDLLLDYAASIFGEILLDFQAVAPDDDETVATLLLDLLQKIDQARLQLSLLQSGLSGLMKRTNMKSS